jgi:hypothetical protein
MLAQVEHSDKVSMDHALYGKMVGTVGKEDIVDLDVAMR